MAGNHKPSRNYYTPFMLTAFVVMVCWCALQGPKPTKRRTLQGADFCPPTSRRQLADTLAFLANRPPICRWLAQPSRSQALRPGPKPADYCDAPADTPVVEQIPVRLTKSVEPSLAIPLDVVLCDVAPQLAIDEARTERLLQVVHPHAEWLLGRFRQLDLSHPGWQLIATCDIRNRHASWPCLFGQWRVRASYSGQSAFSRRYASPPALLKRPLVSNAGERLAMIPQTDWRRSTLRHSGRWDDELIDAMRPGFASGVDIALDQPLVAEPRSLVTMLCEAATHKHSRAWAVESLASLREISASERRSLADFHRSLDRLAYLSLEAESLAQCSTDPGLATSLRRARYAIWRRIDVWRAATALVAPPLEQLTLARAYVAPTRHETVAIPTQPSVDVGGLLAELERFESKPNPANAVNVSHQLARLAQSSAAARQRLADTISVHYRNANARVAITDDLLNRFLPAGQPRVEPVRDRVLGTPVSGQATTQSTTTLTLLPDPHSWRIGIEVLGHADSRTVALERTVRVRTAGVTNFAARQQLAIDASGIRLGEVVADANSTSRFLKASSQYDPLPLIGGVIRSRAASTFAQRRRRAQGEVAAKAEFRVRQEVEDATRTAAANAESKWQTQVIDRLQPHGVTVEPVEMQTTAERVVARVRIAGDRSITAHTPRPRAPADSLASCQLHETAINSFAYMADLAGQRFTGQQLADRMLRLNPDRERRELDKDARNAVIEFASESPVQVELANNEMHVVLRISELVVRGRANRNFKVHVYYTPSADGLVARFDHTKGPFLEGSMRNSQRMRLQTIFGKVFPEGGYMLFGSKYANDPRLEGLMITQLVIDDGWVGVALGPAVANRVAQLDRYAPLSYWR